MLRAAVVGSIASMLFACSPAATDPPMTRSCRGEYVNECRPYDYATVTNASLSPMMIMLNDPSTRAHVHVDFTRCDMASLPLYVQISAFIGDTMIAEPDGGSSDARVIPLTMVGPADAGATSIDVMIDNPFFANVPADAHITLQFAPIIDDCEGALFSSPYHTGMVLMGP